MGVSVSSNTVKNLTQIGINIVNDFTQSCKTTLSANQIVSGDKCPGLKIGKIDVNSFQVINQGCIGSQSVTSQINSAVVQQMRQAAESIVQNFGFPSVAVANNFLELTDQLALNISTTFLQQCTGAAFANQGFVCTNSANVQIGSITLNSAQVGISQCVGSQVSSSSITSQMKQLLDQTATAKEANVFTAIVIALALILIILMVIGGNTLESPWFIIILAGVIMIGVVLYALSAGAGGLFPF